MKKLRTEDQIIANWSGNIDKPVVSICCITYNHEKYIEDAIKGFLIQETDFPFEILIHDDASTDGTQKIIAQYQDQYPNVIKAILQTENQYSKNIRPTIDILYPKAKGKYIALCEGDDYWISPNKLQKQYSYMKSNQNVSLTFHTAIVVRDGKTIEVKANDYIDEQSFTVPELIDNWFISTQTMMLKKSALLGMENYFSGVINGDWCMQLVAGHNGDVVFLKGLRAAYRKHNTSLSVNIGKDKTYRAMKLIKLFTSFDQYSNFIYSAEIEDKIKFYLLEHHRLLIEENCKSCFYITCPLVFFRKLVNKFYKRVK